MSPAGQPFVLLFTTDEQSAGFLGGVVRQVMPSFALRLGQSGAVQDADQAKLIVADFIGDTRASVADPVTEIRAKAPNAPLLVVLSDTSGIDSALASGADEWILRGSTRSEFLARIRYCRERNSGPGAVSNVERQLSIDHSRQSATIGGARPKLRHAEFKILCHLSLNPGRSVSAPELTAVLNSAGGSGSVRTHVMALRKALAEVGYGDLILTDRCRGYRFVESVQVVCTLDTI